jgi:N-alpha-acetyltransferase 15/16, NatA auxiliary subunit
LYYQLANDFTGDLTNVKQEEIAKLLTLYDDLTKQFPKSLAIPRIALNFAQGEEFKKRLEKFVAHYLSKTIPSLFTTLKGLYNDKEKVKIIEQVFVSFLDSLRKNSKLSSDSKIESPLTIVWTLKYMAHHFDLVGDTKKALELINEAIDHTPTIPELYLTRGIVYKVRNSI